MCVPGPAQENKLIIDAFGYCIRSSADNTGWNMWNVTSSHLSIYTTFPPQKK